MCAYIIEHMLEEAELIRLVWIVVDIPRRKRTVGRQHADFRAGALNGAEQRGREHGDESVFIGNTVPIGVADAQLAGAGVAVRHEYQRNRRIWVRGNRLGHMHIPFALPVVHGLVVILHAEVAYWVKRLAVRAARVSGPAGILV